MFEATLWVNGEIVHSEKFNEAYQAETALALALGSHMVREETRSIAWSITGENTDITVAWERVQ